MHRPAGPSWLRHPVAACAVLAVISALAMIVPTGATASSTQHAMIQDDGALIADPVGTLQRLRLLGADQIRVAVRWDAIAPKPTSRKRPAGFKASNPAAYPKARWGQLDTIVRDATQAGFGINFNVVGAIPRWAEGPGAPRNQPYPSGWKPSPSEYKAFVEAVGTRYSGNYDPATGRTAPGHPTDLPRVSMWSVWNEPDYGPSLSPQGLPGNLKVEHAPAMYRGLVDAAWSALHQTGHGRDTFLLGELAPRGEPNPEQPKLTWGIFSGMKPLTFVRAMYCVDVHYKPLRGTAARLRDCPTNAAGSARFRGQHPALFAASGFSDHPYSRWYPPNVEAHPDPDYTVLAEIGNLTRALDKVTHVYHSSKRFPIWNTEYGYITSPPKHSPDGPTKHIYVSQGTAAYYLNWAEYISYRNPRIQSFEQYLLRDPLPALKSNDYGGYASGLLTYGNAQKTTYSAWRTPIYLPVTKTHPGRAVEVWGAARPVHFALSDVRGEAETVQIQFAPGSSSNYTTVRTVTVTDPHGYFDAHVVFPGSGTVRTTWTYPADDLLLAPGYATYSRHVKITVS
jgi:hypothetical protein